MIKMLPGKNPSHREILFIRKTSAKIKTWEGPKYTKKEASNASGVKTVFWLENFDNIFKLLTNEVDNIYVNQNEHERSNSEVDSRNLRFARKLKNQLPAHNFERVTPLITSLREIKSSFEIDIIKQACKITEQGFRRVHLQLHDQRTITGLASKEVSKKCLRSVHVFKTPP